MQPVLITRYFCPDTGDIKLDCFLELDNPRHASAVRMVYLRAGVQQAHPALLHIPEGATRENVEEYISNQALKKEVLLKLKEAKVQENEIIRRKLDTNASDFLASLGGK